MTAISTEIQAEFRKSRFSNRDENHPSAVLEHAHTAAPVGCGHTKGYAAIGIATFSTEFSADQSRSHRSGSETKAGLKPTPQLLAGP